jgi:peptide/nickel transport system substrate-binding protein
MIGGPALETQGGQLMVRRATTGTGGVSLIPSRFKTLATAMLVAITLAACSGSTHSNNHGPSSSQKGAAPEHVARGGVATFAEQPGTTLNYIFPLIPGNFDLTNISQFEDLMWRPLYWIGTNTGAPLYNTSLSLAKLPVFSNGNRVVTISLKPYRWSDGAPLTARDLQFWINLVKAAVRENPLNWGGYVNGYFPDNVLAAKVLGQHTLRLTLNRSYSPTWFTYNQLSQMTPLPQHAWDRTSLGGPVRNYDLTPSGAKSVYNFLAGQSKHLGTYSSNPLWRVVDGPWRLKSFSINSRVSFVPNPRYSGPAKPHLKELIEEPFTTDAAEFSALRAGDLSYGYVPFSDVPSVGSLKTSGYRILPWKVWAINYIAINFHNPTVGPLLHQLYVRQALEYMIDQSGFIKHALHGYGSPTYGPVPVDLPSPYVSTAETTNPYPFNPARAKQLLASHGWHVVPGGQTLCQRPGTGPGECGAGIRQGSPLRFQLFYASGFSFLNQEVQGLKSDLSSAGVQLDLRSGPAGTVLGSADVCTPSQATCKWQMLNWGSGYILIPNYDPTGEQFFETGAASNFGSYSNPVMNSYVRETNLVGGRAAMRRYENYAAKQLPDLWFPEADYQISAVKKTLRGVTPQNPEEDITPENWYFTSDG